MGLLLFCGRAIKQQHSIAGKGYNAATVYQLRQTGTLQNGHYTTQLLATLLALQLAPCARCMLDQKNIQR